MIIQACFLIISSNILCVESKFIAYNTTSVIVPEKINVHLVPHTHKDVGWLKTVDQYYVRSNNTIEGDCVQNILDSLVPALLKDKNRKFIYVEQTFFQRWWREQSDQVQAVVKKLVSSGQLELINGGMCMHDEAATHYIDMIDQTTLGHRFLKEEFNLTPRIGWQIDPFGHSAVQAYLLGAETAKRKDKKTLEVVWRGSKSLGSCSQIFTGVFPENYEPPSDNFYFEVNSESPILQDNINLFDYNVPDRVNDFVSAAISQANVTRTNHIMWTMGTDFQYQYAHTWFRQMDKFIHYVNQNGRVNALYSTPSIYTDAKHAAYKSWPLKADDYFPYADEANAYGTGYFTCRPSIKRYVRTMSGYYLAARQLEFFKGRNKAGPNTDSLADALATAQHHDAVTGTEKQHVADDYAKCLSIGYDEAEKVVVASLSCIANSKSKAGCTNTTNQFQQCPLLNISYCPASEVDLSNGKSLVVLVYNSMGWQRRSVVRIPVINENVCVKDPSGRQIESQLLPLLDASMSIRNYHSMAYTGSSPNMTPKYWLAFSASTPPVGFSTCIISTATSTAKPAAALSMVQTIYKTEATENDTIEIGPGNLKLLFSGKDGKLTQYVNSRSSQLYSYYAGDDGTEDNGQVYYPSSKDFGIIASGAYICRPNGTYPINSKDQVAFTVLRGPLLDEIHKRINSWIYQITRVYKDKEHAEFEFIIGPVPIDDGIGKEVVTKIVTTLNNKKIFYTDSNGRDFIERIRDYRKDWHLQVHQPVAGNYYPINLGISILVDRSVGGSSLADGQLELMLHRRLLQDDFRGVGEALNETVCILGRCTGLTIVGNYFLRIDPLGEVAKWRRSYGQEIYSPFLLAFAEQDGNNWTNSHVATFSAIDPSYVLPDNVAIITLQELDDGNVLLRLAHLYEIGEDKDMSTMASVQLKKLFAYYEIKKVTETSLSGNQERAEMERKRLVWKAEGSTEEEAKVVRGGAVHPVTLVVELAPMEIRTFLVAFHN